MANSIYTDLAMESRELNPDIQGVSEQSGQAHGCTVSRIKIETDEAAGRLDKPVGLYVTLDAPALADRPLHLYEDVSRALAGELTHMYGELDREAAVLVVGLGNRSITPDSLGPRVADKVFVTRHINEYVPDALPRPIRSVCSVAPGVLGTTGIETMETVHGIAEHVKPDLIIAVDSLASRRAARISTTIQLTDTGICPGSGVGNTRKGLTRHALGIPVIAIGVPTVVHAATISQEVISLIAAKTGLHSDEEKLRGLAAEVIDETLGPLVVTPKDIDSIAEDMSRIIADGINLALFGTDCESIRLLTA